MRLSKLASALSSVTKAGEAPPPLQVLPITSADNERRMQLMSFLEQGELEEVTQIAKQVLSDSQLRKFAFYGNWWGAVPSDFPVTLRGGLCVSPVF